MWGSEIMATTFLTWVLDGGEWSVSCPCSLNPGEGADYNRRIWAWLTYYFCNLIIIKTASLNNIGVDEVFSRVCKSLKIF
jgi:hypothetical protein